MWQSGEGECMLSKELKRTRGNKKIIINYILPYSTETRGLITKGIFSVRKPQVKLSAQEWKEKFLWAQGVKYYNHITVIKIAFTLLSNQNWKIVWIWYYQQPHRKSILTVWKFYIIAEWCTFFFPSLPGQVVFSEESQLSVILEGREEYEDYMMHLACSSVPVDSFAFCHWDFC